MEVSTPCTPSLDVLLNSQVPHRPHKLKSPLITHLPTWLSNPLLTSVLIIFVKLQLEKLFNSKKIILFYFHLFVNSLTLICKICKFRYRYYGINNQVLISICVGLWSKQAEIFFYIFPFSIVLILTCILFCYFIIEFILIYIMFMVHFCLICTLQ